MVFDRKKWRRERYLKNKKKENELSRKYYSENREKWVKNPNRKNKSYIKGRTQKERFNEWREKNKEYHNKLMRENYKRNKHKQIARVLARNKIPIPKNKMCKICENKIAIQRHHPDYSKPLDVWFVCRQCNEDLEHKNNLNTLEVRN